MLFASFRPFARRLSKSPAPRAARRPAPAVEALEDRWLPSVSSVASGDLIEIKEGQTFSGVVATFTDPGPSAATTDTAKINWGDGHVSAGTITARGNGLFAVSGTNTWGNVPASSAVVVTISLSGGGEATATSTVLIYGFNSGPPINATEGQPFSGAVATFTDPDPQAASAYTATISWGDGQTSAGTVADLGNGQFSLSGGNTYAHAGLYRVSVQIDPAGGASLSAASAITVADAPFWATRTAQHIKQGQPVTGVLGTLTDLNPLASAGEFTVAITWGDGSTSPGTLQPTGQGTFNITGSHIYATAGAETLTVTVTGEGGRTATANPLITVDAWPGVSFLSASGQVIAATQWQTFTGEVAAFSDTNPLPPASYTATISWGGGQASAGTVAALGNGQFAVSGSHSYAQAGSDTVTVQVNRAGGGSVTATTTATVSPAAPPSAASGDLLEVTEGQTFSAVVATFTDPNPQAASIDTATISWGDGHTSAGTIAARGNGLYAVSGSHTYANDHSDTVVVSISLAGGGTATATSTVLIYGFNSGPPIHATEGQPFSGQVATFTDPNPQPASAYTATISWGDGQTSAGTVAALGNGQFSVSGGNTYAHAGLYRVSVQIDPAGGTSLSATSAITVADAPFWATRTAQHVGQGQPVTGVLGTLTDLNPLAAAGDFTVQINWGDGTKTAGALQPTGHGTFTITGNHVYATAGAQTLTVTVTDEGGRTTTANPLIAVDPAPAVVLSAAGQPIAAQEGQTFSGVVATFSDPNPQAAGAYAAAITWGNGATSAGTVAALGGGRFAVSGSNTYAHAGTYAVSVQVSRPGGVSVTAAATANVADEPFWATRTFQRVGVGQPVTGVLGTLVDLNPSATAGDFTVVIDWGDGTKSPGLLLPRGKGTFDIAGAHDYTSAGARTLDVTITDEGGRTVTTDPLITVDF